MYKRLIPEDSIAPEDRQEFLEDYLFGGCSCHLHPPCGYCTHPGNDHNGEHEIGEWQIISDVQYQVLLKTDPEKVKGFIKG